MTRSFTRAAAALGVAALALAGCAKTGAGAAARVGDRRITTATLTAHVDRALEDRRYAQRTNRESVQRGWLSQLVKAELYREAARRLDAAPTKAQLDGAYDDFIHDEGGREQAEQTGAINGIAPRDLRDVVEASVYLDAVGDALSKDISVTEDQLRKAYVTRTREFDTERLAHVRVNDKATADRVAASARSGTDFATLAKEFSEDAQSAPQGGDIGEIGNGQGRFEKSIEAALFAPGVATGSIVGPLAVQGGFEIFKVLERDTTPYEEARPELRRGILGDQWTTRLNEYLTKLVHELGLSINPRFGRWDPQRLAVVPAADPLSAPEPEPAPPGGQLPGGQPPGGQAPGGQAPGGQAPTSPAGRAPTSPAP